ncbi:MAG TPA: hypothetical protein VFK05_07395 [Polyangiaceae bacterium]|nr:hypothetical protein [Polyangiaceae bacterium]
MSALQTSDRVDVLLLDAASFRCSPQIGVARCLSWGELESLLARPVVATAKDIAGAWSPARYRNNVRRRDHLLSIGAIVLDVDAGGEVERVAEALQRYRAIIHETFSSTAAEPRCRVVIQLAEPIDAASYDKLHAVVRTHLSNQSVEADARAKDASRVSYLPVRRPGAGYRFVVTEGVPVCAARVLAAQSTRETSRPSPPMRSGDQHSNYSRAALRSAARAVATASEGTRNDTLYREAFSIARLDDLGTQAIETALHDAAITAGLSDNEARRTIASALRARRGAR